MIDYIYRYLHNDNRDKTSYHYDGVIDKTDSLLEAGWRNFIKGTEWKNNIITVPDMGYSMFDDDMHPVSRALTLTLFLAETNKGFFKNKYLSFRTHTNLIEIKDGIRLREKINTVMKTDAGFTFNVQNALELIHTFCIIEQVSNEEVPTHLLILTNGTHMITSEYDEDAMQELYQARGWAVPQVVTINVANLNEMNQTLSEINLQ